MDEIVYLGMDSLLRQYIGRPTCAIYQGYRLVKLLILLFLSACLSCRNFIGFNCQFGINYIRDYSDVSSVYVNLVREIRDRSLFISGFDSYELNRIICALVT